MGSAGDLSASPRHSVFISYASEDRPMGRVLRDALVAAGLEVWFDETELGGGDAWDQKIRRQIRDCDYFMPVISAVTERRKEGYFRREWRLAVERTMDMADDVLFLVPVVIDETTQSNARVPDKFLAVQWLRLSGGQPNDALASLCRRLQAGDHRAPPLLGRTTAPFAGQTIPPFVQPAPFAPPPAAEPSGHHALPMPPFPPHPEKGGVGPWLKHIAEIGWWVVNAIWSLIQRLPRWARVLLAVWAILSLFTCSRDRDSPSRSNSTPGVRRPPPNQSVDFKRLIRKAAEEMAKGQKTDPNAPFDPSKYVLAGEKFTQLFASSMDEASDKLLAVVPFPRSSPDEGEGRTVGTIFNAFFGKLMLARSDSVGLVKKPYTGTTDTSLAERGDALDSKFILQATIDTTTEAHALQVRLLEVRGTKLAWSGTYPLANADPAAIADQIADGVLAALPKK